jgi:sucrose-6-phosphate hydrolase SacC (GH32 family)
LDVKVRPGVNPLKGIEGDVFEIIAEIKPNKASEFGFDIRGEKISYNVKDQTVSHRGAMDHKELYNRPARKMEKVSLSMDENSMVKIHLIIDRSSIEAYFNRGEVSLTEKFYPEENNRIISFYSKGGNSVIKAMDLYRLESIWLGREQELGYYRNQ